MRIAMVVGSFPALSETFVLWKIAGLIERGHEVIVVAERPGDGSQHEVVKRYRLKEAVRYSRRAGPHLRQRPVAALRWLTRTDAAGRAARRAMAPRRLGRLSWALGAPLFAGLLGTLGRIDAVSAEQGDLGRMCLLLRDRGVFDAPLATSMIGRDCRRLALQDGRYRDLFARGELMLPVADWLREQLIDAGACPSRTVVHRLPINLELFRFQQPQPVEVGKPLRLLSIGRLVEKKGLDVGIQAVASLLGRGVDTRYRIVGEGPDRSRLEALIEKHQLQDRVSLCGALGQTAVAAEIARCHLVVVPSRTATSGDTEGLPNVVNEALACGRPVVASRHAGIPEVVDEACGRLCPENDAGALAAAIEAMLEAQHQWPTLARTGRERVEAMFDYRHVAERIEVFYRFIVEGGRS